MKLKQKALARLMVLPMVLSSIPVVAQGLETSTQVVKAYTAIEEQEGWQFTSNDDAVDEMVDGVEGAKGRVLKVAGGTPSSSNRISLEEPLAFVTDKGMHRLVVEYNMKIESAEGLKKTFKLFADEYNSKNEVAKLKVEKSKTQHTTESGGYTTIDTVMEEGKWQAVKLIYTPVDGKVTMDMYVDGVKVTETPVVTPYDASNPNKFSNIAAINFGADSKSGGVYYVDQVSITQELMTGVEAPETETTTKEEPKAPEASNVPVAPTTDKGGVKTLEETVWQEGASGKLVENKMYASTPIYQIEGMATSGSNKQAITVEGDSVTVNYKLMMEGSADLKGGFKLYDVVGKEIARFKVDTGKVAHYNAAGAYDKFTMLEDLAWHDVTVVYTKEATGMVTDIYINGTKVNSVPLSNAGDGSSFGSISFFTDSNRTGSYYIDQLTVKEGRHAPTGPMQPTYVGPEKPVVNPDVETAKPALSYEVAEIIPVAYPEANVYGSGLNGHVVKAPQDVITTIDVTAHGVIPNDGVDDTQAVRTLIENAAYGTELYFPNGTYEFITNDSTILALKDGVSLRGESEEGTILKAIIKDSSVTTTFIAGVGVTNLKISDLTLTSKFYGQYPDPVAKSALDINPEQQGNMVYGINLNYNIGTGQPCEAIEIEGVTIENFSRMAIGLRHTQDVRVKGCTFQNATDIGGGGAGYGVSIQGAANQNDLGKPYDSRHNIIEECQFIGPYIRHGVLLQYYTHNNLVINNAFYGTGYGSIDLHGEDEYLNEIAYNKVYDCRWGGGIELGNSGAGHDLAGPLNYVHNNLVQGGLRGIDVVFGTPDTIIENNTIKDTKSSGIMLQNAERTIVKNNTITGVESADTEGKGIYLDYHKGYSYKENPAWGSGKPAQSEIYENTVTGNEVDYAIVDGTDNILHGSVAADGTKVVAKGTNAHLIGLDIVGTQLTTPFLPEQDTYYVYTNKQMLEMIPYTSAKETTRITIGGQVVANKEKATVTLKEGMNTVAIEVVAADGTTTKTYTLNVIKLADDVAVPTAVQTVGLKGAEPSIPVGKPYQLEVIVGPKEATDATVKWEILEGEEYITLSEEGKVTPLKVGVAQVKVSSVQNPEVSDTFAVTVIDKIEGQPDVDPNAVKVVIDSVEATHADTGKAAINAIDGNLQTPWAGLSTAENPVTYTIKLAQPTQLTHMNIAWFKGSERKAYFTMETSVDGNTWEVVKTATEDNKFVSSGLTELPESYLTPTEEKVQYVRFTGHGNATHAGKTSLWNSFYEIEVYGK